MSSEVESSSRRDVHLPPVDASKRGVLETRSGRPRSAPFAELQLTRAEDSMDYLPELPSAGRSLIAGSSEDRASASRRSTRCFVCADVPRRHAVRQSARISLRRHHTVCRRCCSR